MNTQQETPKLEGSANLTSAQALGLLIIARLSVDGFLRAHFIAEMGYVVDAIAEEIGRGLSRLPGGADGDLDAVLSHAQRFEDKKGGAA